MMEEMELSRVRSKNYLMRDTQSIEENAADKRKRRKSISYDESEKQETQTGCVYGN